MAFARASEQARAQFGLLLAEREQGQAPPPASLRISVSDDVASLTACITSSNTSDEAIEHIGQATVVLADLHTQVTARRVLADVLQLHGKTQTLLRSGKQRLRQTRGLIRIEAKSARWQHDYADAADLALRGFENGPVSPMSVQLAYYETNAAALGRRHLTGQDRAHPRRNDRRRPAQRRHRNVALVLLAGTAGDVRAVCRARHWQRRRRAAGSTDGR